MMANVNENNSEGFKSIKMAKKIKKKNLIQPSTEPRKINKDKMKSCNGPRPIDKLKLRNSSTPKVKMNKSYKLLVQTHKQLGLNCDKEFLDNFKDADEIFVERTLYLEYSSKEKAEEKKKNLEKIRLDGEAINVKFWTKTKNHVTKSDTSISYSLSVDVPQTANISSMKRLFPDAFHFIKRKRKKGDHKKYFIVKYSTKEAAEKDLERSCTLTIDGIGISAKLRIAHDQQLSSPLSTKQRIKQLREKMNKKFDEKNKKNKLKMKKKTTKEKDKI